MCLCLSMAVSNNAYLCPDDAPNLISLFLQSTKLRVLAHDNVFTMQECKFTIRDTYPQTTNDIH